MLSQKTRSTRIFHTNHMRKYISHGNCTFFQYSGWQISNKDNYIAVQVTFKVQSRQETIVELHFDPTQHQEVKYVELYFALIHRYIVMLNLESSVSGMIKKTKLDCV